MNAATRGTQVSDPRDLGRFGGVDAWVFDLDNTLYPRSVNLFTQVDQRIRDYVGRLLKLGPEEAQRVQKELLPALRHDFARPDGRARHQAGRLS